MEKPHKMFCMWESMRCVFPDELVTHCGCFTAVGLVTPQHSTMTLMKNKQQLIEDG